MTVADSTPDDAWDASDPPLVRLLVLIRRAEYARARLELLAAGHLPLEREDRGRLVEIQADLARIVADLLAGP